MGIDAAASYQREHETAVSRARKVTDRVREKGMRPLFVENRQLVKDCLYEGVGILKQQYSIGVLKQEIIKIYNSINQEIFGIGIKSQKIEISGDKVFIFATHKRIPALKILDQSHRSLTANVDVLLMEANKKMLKEQLEKTLGLEVKLILKDYDPATEYSGTVIVLKEELDVI